MRLYASGFPGTRRRIGLPSPEKARNEEDQGFGREENHREAMQVGKGGLFRRAREAHGFQTRGDDSSRGDGRHGGDGEKDEEGGFATGRSKPAPDDGGDDGNGGQNELIALEDKK